MSLPFDESEGSSSQRFPQIVGYLPYASYCLSVYIQYTRVGGRQKKKEERLLFVCLFGHVLFAAATAALERRRRIAWHHSLTLNRPFVDAYTRGRSTLRGEGEGEPGSDTKQMINHFNHIIKWSIPPRPPRHIAYLNTANDSTGRTVEGNGGRDRETK